MKQNLQDFFKSFFYSLAGVDYNNVARHCPPSARAKYKSIILSLMFPISLAMLAGWDIATSFGMNLKSALLVGIAYSILIFILDVSILNYGTTSLGLKLLRISAAIINNIIASIFLLVLLNGAAISTLIKNKNTAELLASDQKYLTEKENRYASYENSRNHLAKYHSERCEPEARNGRPGPQYFGKHSFCVAEEEKLLVLKQSLDSAEALYHSSYIQRNTEIKGRNFNDPFTKVEYLYKQFATNKVSLILGILIFTLTLTLELLPIMLKYGINPDTCEIVTAQKLYDALLKANLKTRLSNAITHKEKNQNITSRTNEAAEKKRLGNKALQEVEKLIPMHYKASEFKRVFRENGLYELANEVSELQRLLTSEDEIDSLLNKIVSNKN